MSNTQPAKDWKPQDDIPEWIAAVEEDIAGIIDSKNHWREVGEFDEDIIQEINERIARFQYEVLLFQTEKGELWSEKGMIRFAMRALMFAWVLSPGLLTGPNGKAMSLDDMAKVFGCSRCWLSVIAEEISRKFQFFSRNQKSLNSRPNYAKGAMKGWEKRKNPNYRPPKTQPTPRRQSSNGEPRIRLNTKTK